MRFAAPTDAQVSRRDFLGLSAALAAGLAMPTKRAAAGPPMPVRGLCAHRGVMATHPENTLPAFREALRLGAHMIEFDVRFTKDGVLALMHDARVDRTTDGEGWLSKMTLEELRQLDAGVRKDERFAGTRIPTFEETLAMMPRNVWLNCHVKGGADLGAAMAAAIVRAGRRHQAFLAAHADAAQAARAVDPEILICNMEPSGNIFDYVEFTIATKAEFIQLSSKGDIDEASIRLLKKNGIRVNFYQAATPDDMRRLFLAGVDFPLVNDLANFLPAAREFGIQPLLSSHAPG